MNKRIILSCGFSGLLSLPMLMFTSCMKNEDSVPQLGNEIDRSTLMSSMQDFQWSLFRQSVAEEDDLKKNVTISPMSVMSTLYMTLRGADGDTRAEMEKSLSIPASDSEVGHAYQQWSALIANSGEKTRLKLANAVFWDNRRISPKEDFLDYAYQYFGSERKGLDFSSEMTLSTINTWVSDETEQRIDKILDEIRDDEVLFILNALFFTGDWQYPFPMESTTDRPFILSDGSIVDIPTMYQDISTVRYTQAETYDAAELPFADTNYLFTLILPKVEDDLNSFIAELNFDRFQQISQQLRPGRILLSVPRFETTYKILLNTPLKQLGIEQAFDSNRADFSRLGEATQGNLFLTKVLHKTFLKIDEKGAEGAAVTSIGVGVTSLPPSLFFDRPFIFVLHEKTTGSIVFIGKLENPQIQT